MSGGVTSVAYDNYAALLSEKVVSSTIIFSNSFIMFGNKNSCSVTSGLAADAHLTSVEDCARNTHISRKELLPKAEYSDTKNYYNNIVGGEPLANAGPGVTFGNKSEAPHSARADPDNSRLFMHSDPDRSSAATHDDHCQHRADVNASLESGLTGMSRRKQIKPRHLDADSESEAATQQQPDDRGTALKTESETTHRQQRSTSSPTSPQAAGKQQPSSPISSNHWNVLRDVTC